MTGRRQRAAWQYELFWGEPWGNSRAFSSNTEYSIEVGGNGGERGRVGGQV